MESKLKKRRQKIRKQRQLEELNDQDELLDSSYTQENAESDFDLLKTTPVSNENIIMFMENLVLTHSYRSKILFDKTIDLQENFPYFFVRPDLVTEFYQKICFIL